METAYGTNGTIKRTVLARLPLGAYDLQSLPPWAWCEGCGAEVYIQGHRLCTRCRQ